MSPPIRSIGHSPSAASGAWTFVKSLYGDEFRWSLVKSVGFFCFGVALAREFKGVDLMAPQQPM
jgi:hypothetical protein